MVAEYADNGGTLTLRRSYVHGLQYIDERAVMRDHEGDGQDYYYLLQELYSVSGLATSNGLRAEHAVYDAYGQVTLYAWPSADVNGDGAANILDQVLVRDADPDSPLYDVNLDGGVDVLDLVVVRNQLNTSAVATTTSNVDNPYYFTGRLTDTLHASDLLVANDPHFRRLQDNRNRTYDPKHGRWLQRDPLQYVDGMNLFEYSMSAPLVRQDPLGMGSIKGMAGELCTMLMIRLKLAIAFQPRGTLGRCNALRKLYASLAYGGMFQCGQAAILMGHWLDGTGSSKHVDEDWFKSQEPVPDFMARARWLAKRWVRWNACGPKRCYAGWAPDREEVLAAPTNSCLHYAMGTFTMKGRAHYRRDAACDGGSCCGKKVGMIWFVKDTYDWNPGEGVTVCGVWIPDNYALELEGCPTHPILNPTSPRPFDMSFMFADDASMDTCVTCK